MDVIAYVNRINTWPEYVKINAEKKQKGETKNEGSDTTCGSGENRVLCRFAFLLCFLPVAYKLKI